MLLEDAGPRGVLQYSGHFLFFSSTQDKDMLPLLPILPVLLWPLTRAAPRQRGMETRPIADNYRAELVVWLWWLNGGECWWCGGTRCQIVLLWWWCSSVVCWMMLNSAEWWCNGLM